jgi:hypothetical protein
MANILNPQKPMPFPRERAAPKWSGKEKHLMEFLRSFETAAAQAGLTSDQKCVQLGKYCKHAEDQDLLESLDGFAPPRNWDDFKAAILREFPTADPEAKYSIESLDRLVRKTHKKSAFKHVSSFSKFNQKFRKQATWLKKKHLITDEEIARLYLKGFPKVTRSKIEKRLEIIHYTNTDPRKKYTFEEIRKAVDYIMRKLQIQNESSSEESSESESASESESDDEDSDVEEVKSRRKHKTHRSKTPPRSIKPEKQDIKIKEEPNSELHNLILKMNTNQESNAREFTKTVESVSTLVTNLVLTLNNINNNQTQDATSNVNNVNDAILNSIRHFERCTFCGATDGHIFRNCPTRQEYEFKNYIKRDNNNWLVMHTGEPIPNTPQNSPLKVRIDACMKQLTTLYQSGPWNSPPPSTPTLMIETNPKPNPTFSNGISIESTEESDYENNFEDASKELRELVQAIEEQNQPIAEKNEHPMITRSKSKVVKPKREYKTTEDEINEISKPPTQSTKETLNQTPPNTNDNTPLWHNTKSCAEYSILLTTTTIKDPNNIQYTETTSTISKIHHPTKSFMIITNSEQEDKTLPIPTRKDPDNRNRQNLPTHHHQFNAFNTNSKEPMNNITIFPEKNDLTTNHFHNLITLTSIISMAYIMITNAMFQAKFARNLCKYWHLPFLYATPTTN